MTNYEKYKDKIEEIIEYDDSGIAVVGGKPVECDSVRHCEDCQFFGIENCNLQAIRWSAQEYEPKSVAEQCEVRNYDEMRTKIENQRKEITRLIAENKGLKEQSSRIFELEKQLEYYKTGTDVCDMESERIRGQNEAWEMARKIALMDDEGGYTDEELTGIFGTGNDYYVFKENPTYPEVAAKVAEWEKKQEICVGDVVEYKSGDCGLVTRTYEMWVEGIKAEGTRFQWHKSFCKKTGRHIDVSAMLAQIGGDPE